MTVRFLIPMALKQTSVMLSSTEISYFIFVLVNHIFAFNEDSSTLNLLAVIRNNISYAVISIIVAYANCNI